MNVQKANVIEIGKNILGTIDIDMKIGKMRKSQEFSVYPIGADENRIIFQSGTRIGMVNKNGIGFVSKSYSGGAYFVHLNFGEKIPFEFEPNDWSQILTHIGLSSPEGSSGMVKIENQGASQFANS